MNQLWSILRSRYPAAVAAGLLLACAFPNLGIAGFAWIAPGLILLAAMGCPPGQTFRLGFVAGWAHYLATLWWLLLIPVPWTWKWAPALGWVALSAFLALYPAVWVWLCWKIYPANLAHPSYARYSLTLLTENFHKVPWAQRVLWSLTGAALWVGLEMIVARFLGGFPWNLLGASQFRLVPLLQICSYTGVYGVSFLVVWSSLSLLCAGMVVIRRAAVRSAWVGEIFLPMLVVSAVYLVGYHKLLKPEPKRPEITVALVQPSIPQNLIWNPADATNRFQQLLQLSRAALTNKPDLMLWPESAVPGWIRYDTNIFDPIANLARSHKVWLIVCADDFEPRPNARNPDDVDSYNASFLVAPDGSLAARYIKRQLVIFGEYVPLTHVLPFLKYLTPIEGGFTPGKRAIPFDLTDLNVHVSVLICFEDVFPQLVPEYVSDDTDFLINLTNNGWFGEGPAQWQHAASAVFRAIENGVPLVRCANNGLTCVVDECGRIRQVFTDVRRGIYGPGFLIANVPVLAPGEKRVPTYYRQYGDRFGWACLAVSAFLIVSRLLRQRRKNADAEAA